MTSANTDAEGTKLKVSIGDRSKYLLRAVSNVHRQGDRPNILLFATPRGGSTWLMEILASQPGMKYYDEPFNIRRKNVTHTGLFPTWDSLMPEKCDPEVVVNYLNGLANGSYRHMNPAPFRPYHRFITNRIVFKIHELEHLIGRIAKDCRGQVVFLLRHPIPTSLSRTVLPRLDLFLTSPYYADVIGDGPALRRIRQLGLEGTRLQQGTVAWCYQNLIPLRRPDFDGLFVTYEELVLNPLRSCDLLLEQLHLDDRNSMLRAFGQASTNIHLSNTTTRDVLAQADPHKRADYLVSKWRSQVTADDMAAVSEVMELFGLDVYSGDRLLANPRYLHFPDTVTLVDDMTPVRSASRA